MHVPFLDMHEYVVADPCLFETMLCKLRTLAAHALVLALSFISSCGRCWISMCHHEGTAGTQANEPDVFHVNSMCLMQCFCGWQSEASRCCPLTLMAMGARSQQMFQAV